MGGGLLREAVTMRELTVALQRINFNCYNKDQNNSHVIPHVHFLVLRRHTLERKEKRKSLSFF